MQRTALVLLAIVSAVPVFADAGEHLIPAGSLIGCTISEPRINSKTTAVGDPVLCQVSHTERYGRSTLPYDSYLVGRFEDYKDPGHFVGKGWMELRFDRMVIEPDTVIPIAARVVDVPGYRVDEKGRILGKGHAVRDSILWTIPILWPIDLINLPRRGPRPTLKEETRLTLKVMDDLVVPPTVLPQQDPYGLSRRPTAELAPPPPPAQDQPAPQTYADAAPPAEDVPPPPAYAAPAPAPYAYAAPMVAPPPVAYGYAPGIVAGVAPGFAVGVPYGRGFYAPRAYGYGGPRGYGYPGAPRAYGYGGAGRPAPRAYGYGGAPRAGYAPGYARGGAGYASRGGGGGAYRGR